MNLQNTYFSFLGGDARTPWARAYLEEAGCPVVELSHPKLTHIVLPLPALTASGSIPGGCSLTELETTLRPGITLLGGKLEAWRDRLEHTGATILDYFEDELLTAANASVTAEGALLLAMEQLPVTLAGTPVLVTGWGRIGQLLSRKLQALGAQVTVSARRCRDLGMIQATGMNAMVTGQWGDLSPYRVIFNTIPAPILSQKDLEQTRPDCLLLELASAPGGMEAGGSRSFIQASGLPGKTAPETAGRLIGETILRLAQGQERSSHVG